MYRDSLLGKPVPQEMLDLADHTASRYEIVERILDVGEAPDGMFFRVQWDGLPDESDFTWNPIQSMFADVPDMVHEFLSTYSAKPRLVSKIKRQLGISV